MPQPKSQDQLSQSAIDWQSFYASGNIPIIGYDPINDQIIIKRGAKNDTLGIAAHAVYIYDMRTGAWTKSMNGLTDDVDVTNFVVNGDSELVTKACDGTTSTIYKWQPGNCLTSTFNWTSKAFDFNYPALKKKLYKVIIHSKEGDNMDVNVYYDNKTTISSAADGQAFNKPLNSGSSLIRNEMTIATPTAFSYLTLEIKSDGASAGNAAGTSAAFEINDIALVYRVLRPH